MKVIQKKNTSNGLYAGEEVDYLALNRLNKAITDYYLPQWGVSPLKSQLLKQLGTFKTLYLYLYVTCEPDGKTVFSVALHFDLLDDWERMEDRCGNLRLNKQKIEECITRFFQSIGYDKIECRQDEDIAHFILRLIQDIPVAADYFEVVN